MKNRESGQLSQKILNFKESFTLTDIWRCQNEQVRDYTFFSNQHESWSRIDMIWVTTGIISNSSKVKIHPRTTSDYCAISFKIQRIKNIFRWRLDENLFKKEDIEINRKYFSLNNTPDISDFIRWDAGKAVMRGYLIQQRARKNREKKAEEQRPLQEIKELEENFKKKEKDRIK